MTETLTKNSDGNLEVVENLSKTVVFEREEIESKLTYHEGMVTKLKSYLAELNK